MTEDAELLRVLAGLRAQYLAEAPGRIADLRAALDRVIRGETAALAELRQLLHRLAGSGGAYGLQTVTDTARAGELAARTVQERGGTPSEDEIAGLTQHITAVASAFGAAQD